jgi:cell division transport system permease protein
VQRQIDLRADVAETQLIIRAEALGRVPRLSGFGEAMDLLDEQPLPAVVLVKPERDIQAPMHSAMAELQATARSHMAQVDLQWVARLGRSPAPSSAA